MPTDKRPERRGGLSMWGWSLLLTKATAITCGLILKAVGALFKRRKDSLTFHQYIGYAGVRDYQCGLDAISIQNLLPATSKTCAKFARTHGIEQSRLQLADGTIALWLGPRKAAKTIVFFHGGGYIAPALSEHMLLAFGFDQAPRRNVSVVVLQYDLASENANHYPRQLQQAVSLIDHLLHTEEMPPSSMTLMGDSAGAHLLLSLILHISHTNPSVSPLPVEGHFSNAVLVSPWVNMGTSAPSMQANKEKDILTVEALAYWARSFRGNAVSDHWNDPLTVPPEWWSNLPVREVLVLYGDNELLRDDTSTFCERLKAHHPQTTALKFSDEIHGHSVMNRFLKINKPCESERVLVKWMDDHLW